MKKILCFVLTVIMLFSLFIPTVAFAEEVELLKIAHGADEGSLTPYTYSFDTGLDIVRWVYDPLLCVGEDQKVQPWLAESYEISTDGLTYSFKLKDGVKFHDGTPLTAEDVKFTYEYLQKFPKSRFSGPAKVIKSINIKDPLNVDFILEKAQTDEFLVKPLSELGILPKHLWENVTKPDEATLTVGSGPYKLVEVKVGEFYRFEANNDYWNGKPAIKSIYMPIISDANSRNTALLSGQIDASSSPVPTELIEQFKTNQNLKTTEGPVYSTQMIVFNAERKPFDNVKFRQALAYATNLQEIVDTVALGNATLGSYGFVHPAVEWYNPLTYQYAFDPEKSKALLDELGFVDSNDDGIREQDGKELNFELLVYANNTMRIRIAEIVKEYYANVGVGVIVKALDAQVVDDLVWPEYDAQNGRNFDMTTWGWGASTMPTPGRYVDNTHSDLTIGTANIGHFSDAKMDEILNRIDTLLDKDQRTQAIKDFQVYCAEQVPYITLYYPNEVYAYNHNVFDGWKFVSGKGIMTVHSVIDKNVATELTSEQTTETVPATQVENTTQPEQVDAGIPILWISLGIAAAVALVFILKNRSKK